MKGFLVYITYRADNIGAKVYLFGRLENGESFMAVKSFRPYFFFPADKKDVFHSFSVPFRFEVEDSDFKNFRGEPLAKVTLWNPKEVPNLRKELTDRGVDCLEADIRFVNRFLIDQDIRGSLDLEGDFTKGKLINRVYMEPKISASDAEVKLKVLSIDIETDGNAKKLFSVGLHSENYNKVMIVYPTPVEGCDVFPDEKSLLTALSTEINNLDPDAIVGWNFVDFDLKVLDEKYRQAGIPFCWGRVENWNTSLKIKQEYLRDSEAEIPGRLVLVGIALLKSSFVKLEDYRLDTAASTLLGEAKTISFTDKRHEIEQLYKNEPAKLAKYNLKDAELVYNILVGKGIIDLAVARSKLTGMLPDRVKASVASLDSLYLRETQKLKIVCNSNRGQDREERIKGGFVMNSSPGIYSYVSVFDFKSLYPSIIRTFNIDPLSYSPNGEIIMPNGARFKNEDGILPMLIERLWAKRDIAKKKGSQIESNAIKITMNSFFGVLANPSCRFYSLEVANGITSGGQMIIKKTSDLLTAKGLNVIYGDTDSIFIKLETNDLESANEISKGVIKEVNDFYNTWIPTTYNRKSFLELQYEKTFTKFIMPKIRDSDVGSKKRYAGMLIKDGKEQIVFTGLEFVRRDWTEAAKRFQMQLLDLVFHEQDIKSYIRTYVADLKAGKINDLLVYRRQLRKDVDGYTKTTPPHVKAARQMEKIDNPVISYYQTIDGPQPAESVRSSIDFDHYIEKQIKPIADSILSFSDETFEDIITKSKQQTLFSF